MFAAFLKVTIKPVTDRYNGNAKKFALPLASVSSNELIVAGCNSAIADAIAWLIDVKDVTFVSATIVVGQDSVELSIITSSTE